MVDEIFGHRLYTNNTWWLIVEFECLSGDYENGQDESQLEDVYNDLADEVIAYAQNLGEECELGFAKAIASLCNKSVESLFPNVILDPRSVMATTMDEETTTVNKPTTNNQPLCCASCDHTYNPHDYEPQESDYYWACSTRKYFGIPCILCAEAIGTKADPKLSRTKPSAKNPVYVCKKFAMEQSNCKHIVCSSCWLEGLSNESNNVGTSRRSCRGTRM